MQADLGLRWAQISEGTFSHNTYHIVSYHITHLLQIQSFKMKTDVSNGFLQLPNFNQSTDGTGRSIISKSIVSECKLGGI